jgi:hypothetical protein
MGAWSPEPFGNDSALDWAQDLVESDGPAFLAATFETVLEDEGDYLDAELGEVGLAAAAVLAQLLGPAAGGELPESLQAWLVGSGRGVEVGAALRAQALAALERIAGNASELHELWAETDALGEWLAQVKALRAALGG